MVSRLCECLNALKCFAFILFHCEKTFATRKDNGDIIIQFE